MTQKHTPGPWTLIDSSEEIVILDKDGFTICNFQDVSNDEANAALIAAAPDLLEALKDTKRSIEFMPKGIGRGAMAPLYEQVCAAIAKAEGR